jgi:hypothetical protein
LIGDSNAAHYFGMLRLFADEYKRPFRNITHSACPITFTGKRNWVSKKYRDSCLKYLSAIESEISKYETVIIGGNWGSHYKAGRKEFKQGFNRAISKISKTAARVIVLEKAPTFKNYNQKWDARSLRIPTIDCTDYFNVRDIQIKANKYILKITKKYKNVYFFSARNQLCTKGYCSPYKDGKSLYFDKSHISMVGSQKIGQMMIENNDINLRAFE